MTLLATSTFLQVLFAAMIVVPIMILWVAAVVDVLRQGGSGLKIATMLVLILIVPILGPILYFVFRQSDPGSAGAAHKAEAEMRREAAGRPIASTGMDR